MWPRFGIKIGNSTLCIAHIRADGKVEVIANKQGDRVSQACLLWDGANEIECGLTAKQKMATRPRQAVAHSFQLLQPKEQLTEEQLTNAIREIPCEFDQEEFVFRMEHTQPSEREDQDDKVVTKEMGAYEVTIELLKAELELAHQYHTDSEHAPIAVISIPSYYTSETIRLLSDAAKTAGFHVAQIIAEPTAAVLGYKIGEEPLNGTQRQHVLAIKCGGLYSHFSLYAVQHGYYVELATFGPYPIGGRQFTEALVQFICEEFKRKYKLDPHESRRSLAKIRTAAANCKHILTTLPSTQLYIDSLMDGVDYNVQMSRARFESLIQPVINQFIQQLGECVDRAQQEHPEDLKRIDDIVLLGATMQIPKLQAAVAARFPDAKLHNSHSADEVVAIGCARQAVCLLDPVEQQLQKADDCVLVEDDLYIWHGNDKSNAKLVLGKGSVLPAKIRLSLPQSGEGDANNSMAPFMLRTGESEILARLPDTTPTEDGLFKLEVEVDWNDKDGHIAPLVRLRCM
ncbi:uncharacterized protein Dwil_GK18039 [Drosophila willistoni]|uniref:Heat shock 70 kDa protein 14 n=1 Tax=Drosophila willistoni TaxID=7260 RepID=B4N6D6_DROWI|nr:heat shock 70 kDa protein 14 [Drosophila willistoni]EDW79925.1 uncharacterized protein Dwil_GK18039 [Drosophila willistoni]